MAVVLPPVPANIGFIDVNQIKENIPTPVQIGACSEENMKDLTDFHLPKLGDFYEQTSPLFNCVNDLDIYIQGEESYRDFMYSYVDFRVS